MKKIKKQDGYTLIELIVVTGILGFIMLFLSSNYLSVYKTYIKSSTKAQNLEEARFIVNQIEEEFRNIGTKNCYISIQGQSGYLKSKESGIVEKIEFKNNKNSIFPSMTIRYNNNRLIKQGNEIGRDISNFSVSQEGDLINFIIEIEKKGKEIVEDQVIQVNTTVNLKYTGNDN